MNWWSTESGNQVGPEFRGVRSGEPLLLPAVSADDVKHHLCVTRFLEGLSEFIFMEQLGNVGQGMEVFLKLALRNEKKHDEFDGLIVERVEVNSFPGAAKRAHHLIDQVRGGVWDADAEPNPCAHRRFPLLDHGGDLVAVVSLDFACRHE